jgi:hypothetical protein
VGTGDEKGNRAECRRAGEVKARDAEDAAEVDAAVGCMHTLSSDEHRGKGEQSEEGGDGSGMSMCTLCH